METVQLRVAPLAEHQARVQALLAKLPPELAALAASSGHHNPAEWLGLIWQLREFGFAEPSLDIIEAIFGPRWRAGMTRTLPGYGRVRLKGREGDWYIVPLT